MNNSIFLILLRNGGSNVRKYSKLVEITKIQIQQYLSLWSKQRKKIIFTKADQKGLKNDANIITS